MCACVCACVCECVCERVKVLNLETGYVRMSCRDVAKEKFGPTKIALPTSPLVEGGASQSCSVSGEIGCECVSG